MRTWRENPDSKECQATSRQNEREIFALKMQHLENIQPHKNMTHTKHTPGPWVIEDGLVQSENGSPIAILQNEMPGRPIVTPAEMHANARLIAAAPSLLAALEACREVLAKIPAFGDTIGSEVSKAQLGCAHKAAKDALALVAGDGESAPSVDPRDAEIARLRGALRKLVGIVGQHIEEHGQEDCPDGSPMWTEGDAISLSAARAALAEGGAR